MYTNYRKSHETEWALYYCSGRSSGNYYCIKSIGSQMCTCYWYCQNCNGFFSQTWIPSLISVIQNSRKVPPVCFR